MKENAILVKTSGIEKVCVDFSDDENICKAIESKGLSTIHTQNTQDISRKLGFHIVGYVDRHGGNLDNELAARISGYDEIYSSMLLCKTNDKWDNLPLSEDEVEILYTYLTTGKVVVLQKNDLSKAFFERYGIDNPPLPKGFEPEVHQLPEVPYVILFRYYVNQMKDNQIEEFGESLFSMADRLIEEGFKEVDGVKLSPDGKYYINSSMDHENAVFNVLIQAKENDGIVLITNVKSTADGIMGKVPEHKHVDIETSPEEAGDDYGDNETEDD